MGTPLLTGRIEWQICAPMSLADDRRRFDDPGAAIAAALVALGPNVTQVTLTRSDDPWNFDVRHLTWRNGQPHDSGWRCWRADKFVGAGAAD